MSDCSANVEKGKQLMLLLRNDADTEWQLVGGLTSRGLDISNPTTQITSSSTQGEFLESQSTGYSQISLSASGVADKRQGLHSESGYNFAPNGKLLELATTGERCGKFMLINLSTGGMASGCFTITSYSKSAEQESTISFEMSLESREGVTVTGDL